MLKVENISFNLIITIGGRFITLLVPIVRNKIYCQSVIPPGELSTIDR
jgi:hypothetical protein